MISRSFSQFDLFLLWTLTACSDFDQFCGSSCIVSFANQTIKECALFLTKRLPVMQACLRITRFARKSPLCKLVKIDLDSSSNFYFFHRNHPISLEHI